jgi:hypothetical protein
VAEKGSVTNIYKWLKNIYWDNAVDKSTVSHWTSQTAGSEEGQAKLKGMHHLASQKLESCWLCFNVLMNSVAMTKRLLSVSLQLSSQYPRKV